MAVVGFLQMAQRAQAQGLLQHPPARASRLAMRLVEPLPRGG